jgi:hypothetical protein
LTHLRWSRQNRRQCWTPSKNTTSRMRLKSDRSAVHTHGRGVLWGWRWAVCKKSVSD